MIRRLARCLFLIAACSLPFSAQSQAESIRLGAILSTTGPLGFVGDSQKKILELYVKRLNEQGGLLGKQIILTTYDDQSDPNSANTFAKRLIESDKVHVVLGGIGPPGMAVVPHAERAGIPFVSVGGSLQLVEPVKKWVFKTPHSDRMVAVRLLQDMQQRGFKRLAMLSETTGFGQSGRKEIIAAAPSFGITVVGEDTYGPKDTDVTPQLTKMRALQGIDTVLIFSGVGTSPAMAIKSYAQVGMKLPVYMPHSAVTNEFIKLGGAATEGVRLPAPGFVVPDALAADDPQKKLALDFYRIYREAYGIEVPAITGNIVDAFSLATDAIRRAGSTDPGKIRDALESTKNLVALNGTFTMSPTDHNGLKTESLRMTEVRGGKFELAK
jgi:branched-chain amino acid transport system substrate-binding protein